MSIDLLAMFVVATAYAAVGFSWMRRAALADAPSWMMTSRLGDDTPKPAAAAGASRRRVRRPRKPSKLPPELQIRSWLLQPDALDTLRRWMLRLCVPRQDARDLAQDAAEAALKSAHTYNPTLAYPERWVNRVALHVVLHWRDRAQHRYETLVADVRTEDERPTAAAILDGEETRAALFEGLAGVKPEERAVLVAHDIDGIPMAEIAAQRGIPVSTAYKWRARAHAALEEWLIKRFEGLVDCAAPALPARPQRAR